MTLVYETDVVRPIPGRLMPIDIEAFYSDSSVCIMECQVLGALGHWLARLDGNKWKTLPVTLPAFSTYLSKWFPNPEIPEVLTYSELKDLLSEEALSTVPEILALNEGDDFIDLGALGHNMFYSIYAECIYES